MPKQKKKDLDLTKTNGSKVSKMPKGSNRKKEEASHGEESSQASSDMAKLEAELIRLKKKKNASESQTHLKMFRERVKVQEEASFRRVQKTFDEVLAAKKLSDERISSLFDHEIMEQSEHPLFKLQEELFGKMEELTSIRGQLQEEVKERFDSVEVGKNWPEEAAVAKAALVKIRDETAEKLAEAVKKKGTKADEAPVWGTVVGRSAKGVHRLIKTLGLPEDEEM